MARTGATINSATYSAPAIRTSFDDAATGVTSNEDAMRGMIAACVRAGKRVATKGGFAGTNGGYICRNRCR